MCYFIPPAIVTIEMCEIINSILSMTQIRKKKMMQKSHFLEENLFMGLFHIFIFYVAYVCAASIQCLRPHGL